MKQRIVINFPVSIGTYSTFVNEILNMAIRGKSSLVFVANVHMFIEAYKHKDFCDIVKKGDIVTPDGQPLVWAVNKLYHLKQERVSGMDLLPSLLNEMPANDVSAYFYGGTESMMNNTKVYLNEQHPRLKIAGFYSPPFRQYNETVESEVIDCINSSSKVIVFVVLGCPKQERWMNFMKNKINAVMIGIGGALPVAIGMQKRAPSWMQKHGLEWLFRLSQEPRRLYKRYLYTNTLFLWIFLKEFIKKIVTESKIKKIKKK